MVGSKLLAGTSILALASFSPALAQQAAGDSPNNVEQVVVSASRITVAGYEAPTPVTVLSADVLTRDAQPDLGDELRQLPAIGFAVSMNSGTNGSTSNGTNGLDLVNLRQLGVPRTLVLIDGQRVVNANATGGVDLSTLPTTLLERVDIVTGGASAAWGSDAVAGVVNLILNKNFSGISANLEGSSTTEGDVQSEKAEASFGTDFDGTRGHIIVSLSDTMSPHILFAAQRGYDYLAHLFNNPAYNGGANGQPEYITLDSSGESEATRGGLIGGCGTSASTSSKVNCALTNTQFIGPGATPTTFNAGIVTGAFASGPSAESALFDGGGFQGEITAPYHQFNFFNYERYNLTDNISASLELSYGQQFTQSESGLQKLENQPISINNAYLPASISAEMAKLGYNYIFLGTNNLNGSVPSSLTQLSNNSIQAAYGILGAVVPTVKRQQYRGVASLDGGIGNDWTWSVYAEHGMVRSMEHMYKDQDTANYANAVNAVNVTAANVGNSGLTIGTIQCASTLTNPTNGCVPLDVFGETTVPAATMNYIDQPGNFGLEINEEDVAAGSMSGQLPAEWSLPAGRIAVAFGAEARKESAVLTSDLIGQATGWTVGNYGAFSGHYSVEEGFAEVDVPVLKDNIVQSLGLNAAGRITDYSTSGMVETWKLGATSQINDDVRLRGTWSFDIRAPNIAELFQSGEAGLGALVDPYTHLGTTGYVVTGGNPNLKPEESITVSEGVVLTPHWVDGLSLSADWYSINITKAIAIIADTTTLTLCSEGNAFYCSQVYYKNGILYVNSNPINANSQTVSGLDFQSDYNFPFMDGSINLHFLGNYTDEQSQLAQGIYFDYAGSVGADSSIVGLPKFRSTLDATYNADKWQATVQGRFIGAAKINNAWGPLQIDNNNVPPVAYLDLRGSYDLTPSLQFYGAIDNVTDVPPPRDPSTTGSIGTGLNTIYDAIGRMFHAGIRVKL